MSAQWPEVKLGSLCSVVTKGTTPTSVGMGFSEQGIPFLRITDIQNGNLSLGDVLHISDETHKALNRSIIRPGDLLITIAGTIGKTTVVPQGFPECNCNQAIAIVRFDKQSLSSQYLLHWLNSPAAHRQIHGKKVTATISNLSLRQIKELTIPLPPMAQQKRIAAILDKADQLRQKRQQAIALADDFFRSVFLDMFGDPVTNPKGWEVRSLENSIHSIVGGWSANGENEPARADQLGVLKISSVTSGKFQPSENKVIDASAVGGRKLIFPKKGDLLFSRANTRELVAATVIVDADHNNIFLPDKLWRIDFDNESMLPEFFHYLLMHPKMKDKLTSQATGTSGSMLNISKKKLIETEVILPPIEKQRIFAAVYWAKVQANRTVFNSAICVQKLFSSLSQRAFGGEL